MSHPPNSEEPEYFIEVSPHRGSGFREPGQVSPYDPVEVAKAEADLLDGYRDNGGRWWIDLGMIVLFLMPSILMIIGMTVLLVMHFEWLWLLFYVPITYLLYRVAVTVGKGLMK